MSLDELFENYYKDNEKGVVDYNTLSDFNEDLADDFVKSPIKLMNKAEKPVDGEVNYKGLISGLDDIKISDLRESDLDSIIVFEGIVSQSTQVVPKLSTGHFECRDSHITKVKQDLSTDIKYPRQCSNDNCNYSADSQFELIPRRSEKISFQKIVIQEPHDTVESGKKPDSIDVYLRDDLTGLIKTGDRVKVAGIYRSTDKDNTSILKTYVEGVEIDMDDDSLSDVDLTEDDIKKIKELSENDDIYEMLINSIAPTIKGLRNEKEAVIYQLFRGVQKSISSDIRGDIHILLIGDPSVGKSQLLNYVSKIAPNAVISSGKSASEAGITVAAVRSKDIKGDEEWTLKAGAMVLADEGIACIDELDKMEDNDRDSLHEAMEQQQISVAKAGINTTLKSRTALLGAANPKQGRWNEFDAIQDQIDLDPPLISRFDLIFAPTDDRDRDEDEILSDHIIRSNKYAEQVESDTSEVTVDSSNIEPDIEPELLKKYISYARNNYKPVLTKEAEDKIKSFFVEIRDTAEGNDNVPITARKIEAIIRVCEAAARVQLSNEITEEHAERGIRIIKESLKDVGYDEEAGRFDVDKIETGNTKTQRDRLSVLTDIIESNNDEGDKGCPKDIIFEEMKDKDYEEDKIEYTLRKAQRDGRIYEPVNGEYETL